MTTTNDWLLPYGVEELLPPLAEEVEDIRLTLLSLYRSWGYRLVMTPFIEFEQGLLATVADDLAERTFRLTDPGSGKPLVLRSDITPQLARLDAHRLRKDGVARYCYSGTVLRTEPTELAGSRSPLQTGVELYGEAGIEADWEVISLMLRSMVELGIEDIVLDLGHVAVFSALTESLKLTIGQEKQLFDALQTKCESDIVDVLEQCGISSEQAQPFLALLGLMGDETVLDRAEQELGVSSPLLTDAIEQMKDICARVKRSFPGVDCYIDMSELRECHYHTGLVFALYRQGAGRAIAQGGRYDNIGERFGRQRPATGFSLDLRTLSTLAERENCTTKAILAPVDDCSDLDSKVEILRAEGEVVIRQVGGDAADYSDDCDRVLARKDEEWIIVSL